MFKKNNFVFGIVLSVVVNILTMALFDLILHLFDLSLEKNAKIFLLSFIPNIILLRYYSKQQLMHTVKAIITVLFFGFCTLLYFLYASGHFGGNV
ncbi:MAG TPA: hypothetical protein IAC47_06525 [Candidatus Onthomorpha intestinigallinarum]|uniref:Uncharacterized protein n=1 Tax=Candidatus Onthomorpha intestinigallinarum TaxID=2840880 RepID=A0A9D1RI85_9BACT|nr:hypothetical protein [Candidatus Onthomorpha intestinigallinarum]